MQQDGKLKEYLVKKYKDPRFNEDVWDVIVRKDGTIVTKIARDETHGKRYARNLIESGDKWGVRQSSTSSKTPLGQTASDASQYALLNSTISQTRGFYQHTFALSFWFFGAFQSLKEDTCKRSTHANRFNKISRGHKSAREGRQR